MRYGTALGQLRGVGQLNTSTKAVLTVTALGALGVLFVWGMYRALEA